VDAAAYALRERVGGVVAGGEQQAVEQRLEPHVVPEREHPHLGAALVVGELGDQHGRRGRLGLHGDQRGHHLCEARDPQALGGFALPQHLAGVEV
jgi:hypothetical protein